MDKHFRRVRVIAKGADRFLPEVPGVYDVRAPQAIDDVLRDNPLCQIGADCLEQIRIGRDLVPLVEIPGLLIFDVGLQSASTRATSPDVPYSRASVNAWRISESSQRRDSSLTRVIIRVSRASRSPASASQAATASATVAPKSHQTGLSVAPPASATRKTINQCAAGSIPFVTREDRPIAVNCTVAEQDVWTGPDFNRRLRGGRRSAAWRTNPGFSLLFARSRG